MNQTALYYTDKLVASQTELKALKKKLALGSAGRLLFFGLMALCVYQLFHAFQLIWLLSFLVALIGFLKMISWFVNNKNDEKYQLQLIWLYQNELDQLNGKPNQFSDGSAFDDGAGYWSDLDIFGKGSLYHHINRSVTEYGSNTLANRFKNTLLNEEAILIQQKAVQTYGSQMPLVESIIARSLVNKTDFISFSPIFDWLNSPNLLHVSKWAKFIRFALPFFNLVLIALVFMLGNNALLAVILVLGWLQLGIYAKYYQADFNLLGKKENILKQYAQILHQFEQLDPGNSPLLASYQKTAHQAATAISELSNISSRIDQRLNLFLITIANPLFLYDIQNMFSLEAWKIKYKDHLQSWIQLVGEIEQLNSYAIYAFNHQEHVYPQLLQEPMQIQAISLAHPLIAKEKTVPNDIHINGSNQLLLITGSNMSGKTTFLRTIGVNLIMAQIGLPVPAVSFAFSPMKIFSSIRISDSLQENTSYFMAELKKLSKIKTGVQQSHASLVLIDEILRGTNSEDKYYGSAQFVKEMIALNCISLFATHDLKLSELENEFPGAVLNYCFESIIEGDELFFSYQIQRGVAKNRNASFLMKKMGII